MSYLKDISLRRGIALLVFVMAVLVSGTWLTIKLTTDHLMNNDARVNARDWAQFLATNITDLKQIAAGELPSASSLTMLEATRKSGHVFRYIIYSFIAQSCG